jgi:WD40 repeat protein
LPGILVALIALLELWCPTPLRGEEPSSPTYERDIKPLFARRCTVCHRASKRDDPDISGGLALDSLEGILAGTPREKVVVPGQALGSELVRRLAERDEERRMPRDDKPLPEPQQALVRRWIDAGAPRGTPLISAGPKGGAPPRRPRWNRSLEVALPCDVKLAAGSSIAPKGGALAVSLRIGPLAPVTALAFSPGEGLLAVGTYGQVVLWDMVDGHPSGAIQDLTGLVHALAFSRDGRRIAVGSGLPARSGLVQVYTVPDGTKIHEFAGHDDVVYALALKPDGAQLASAAFDQTVRFWNLGLDRPDGVFRGHSDFVYSVAYTPDGRALLTAGKDRTIKRVNSRTLKEERTYSGHNDEVLAVAVHPDGKRFVSAGNEPQIRWWSLQGDKPQARRGGHSGPVQQLAFSGDGRRVISAGGDHTVRIWNGTSGEPIRQLPGAMEWQYAVAISGNGRLAAAGGWDGMVRLWDAEKGRLLATLIQPPGASGRESPGSPLPGLDWLAITPGGHVAAAPELLRKLEWTTGGAALSAEVMQAACHRPDLVAQAMHGELSAAISLPNKR